ncbi:MAG: VWA domain-containing protein [Polyangiales bacterium]|nr:VWA domain-containing protein [Myxococcales bacterium]
MTRTWTSNGLAICGCLVLFGCGATPDDGGVQVTIANLSAGDSTLEGALVVRDELGGSQTIDLSEVELTAEVQNSDGSWSSVAVRKGGGTVRSHAVIVADNSGSQDGNLARMQAAERAFADDFLGDANQLGVVRVSTESKVMSELTANPEEFDAAVDAMFVSNGWTALYDGVRMANEVLERADVSVERQNNQWGCMERPLNSIVVFTDGRDNNSSDMQKTKYAGDGVDTTLSDLYGLNVLGSQTTVYAVGVGRAVDEVSLRSLSERSNGYYTPIDDYKALGKTLSQQAKSMKSAAPFCFALPYCDAQKVRVHARFMLGGTAYDETLDVDVPAGACGGGGSNGNSNGNANGNSNGKKK